MNYKNVYHIKHPLIETYLVQLRNKNSSKKVFQEAANIISQFLFYEACRELKVKEVHIETPICKTKVSKIKDRIVLVPILRAGLAMSGAIEPLYRNLTVGMIGLKRNEKTFEPEFYYQSLDESMKGSVIFLLDPMLATGGSADAALDKLYDYSDNIVFLNLISAPEGIKKLTKKYSELKIFTSSIDEKLNSQAYIIPGLGDAGDRYFGTL